MHPPARAGGIDRLAHRDGFGALVLCGLVGLGLGCLKPREEPVPPAPSSSGNDGGEPAPPSAPDARPADAAPAAAADATAATLDGPAGPERAAPVDAPPPACGPADGVCPPGCRPPDPDCKLALGASCERDPECATGVCVDRVCCARGCSACQTCGPDGACKNLPARARDDTGPEACPVDALCDGDGRCRREAGGPCSDALGCFSNQCAQGLCCDRACGNVCESCAVPGALGRCSPLVNVPDDRACGGTDQICLGPGSCAAVDQKQEASDCNTFIKSDSVTSMAQIITVGRTGRLAGISVPVRCDDANQTVTLEIQSVTNGQPNGRVLASQAMSALLPDPDRWMRLFVFSNPPRINAGTQIAAVFRGGVHQCTLSCYGLFNQSQGYAGGFTLSIFAGSTTWSPEPRSDLVFQTLMLP
jgi:hypothetical protein